MYTTTLAIQIWNSALRQVLSASNSGMSCSPEPYTREVSQQELYPFLGFFPGFPSPNWIHKFSLVWTIVFHDISVTHFWHFFTFTIGPCPLWGDIPSWAGTCRASQGLLRQFCGKGFIGFLPQLLAANRALGENIRKRWCGVVNLCKLQWKTSNFGGLYMFIPPTSADIGIKNYQQMGKRFQLPGAEVCIFSATQHNQHQSQRQAIFERPSECARLA